MHHYELIRRPLAAQRAHLRARPRAARAARARTARRCRCTSACATGTPSCATRSPRCSATACGGRSASSSRAAHRGQLGALQARRRRGAGRACAGAPGGRLRAGWHEHPLFIEAVADAARAALGGDSGAERGPATPLVFTAHSVPVAMAEASPYVRRLRRRRRAPSPSGSATVAGRSPTRAAAAARAIPGSSPTSTTSSATGGRRRARRGGRADRLRLRSRRGAVRPRRRGAAASADARSASRLHRAATVNDHPEFIAHARRPGPTRRRRRRPRPEHGAAEARRRRRRHQRARRRAPRASSCAPSGRPSSSCACSRRATGSAASSRPSARGGFVIEARPRLVSLREAVGARRSASRARHRATGWSARDDRFRKAFVVRGGRLHPLPDGFPAPGADAARAVRRPRRSSPGRASCAWRSTWCCRGGGGDDESLAPSCAAGSGARRSSASPSRWSAASTPPIPTSSPSRRRCRASSRWSARERSLILGLWRANRRAPQAGTSGARWSLFVTFQRRHAGAGRRARAAPAARARSGSSSAWTASSARGAGWRCWAASAPSAGRRSRRSSRPSRMPPPRSCATSTRRWRRCSARSRTRPRRP